MASQIEDCDYYQIGTQDCRAALALEELDHLFDWDPVSDITRGSEQLQTVCKGVRHNGLRKLVPLFSLDANL